MTEEVPEGFTVTKEMKDMGLKFLRGGTPTNVFGYNETYANEVKRLQVKEALQAASMCVCPLENDATPEQVQCAGNNITAMAEIFLNWMRTVDQVPATAFYDSQNKDSE